MLHPYKLYNEDKSIESMDQIIVTIEMGTLYKDLPHGIAVINYIDPKDKSLSFKGVGVFHHGKLHNSRFSCLRGDGWPYSFSKMHNGRPADASYSTQFYKEGKDIILDSFEKLTLVGGW